MSRTRGKPYLQPGNKISKQTTDFTFNSLSKAFYFLKPHLNRDKGFSLVDMLEKPVVEDERVEIKEIKSNSFTTDVPRLPVVESQARKFFRRWEEEERREQRDIRLKIRGARSNITGY